MITKRLICKWGQSDNIGNGFANYKYVVILELSRKNQTHIKIGTFFSSLRRFCSKLKLKQNLTKIVCKAFSKMRG